MIKTARFGWNDEGPIDRELPQQREHGLDEQVEAFPPPRARRSRRRPKTAPHDQHAPPDPVREESDDPPTGQRKTSAA